MRNLWSDQKHLHFTCHLCTFRCLHWWRTQPLVSVYSTGNEHSRVHKQLDCLLWSVHLFVWAQVPIDDRQDDWHALLCWQTMSTLTSWVTEVSTFLTHTANGSTVKRPTDGFRVFVWLWLSPGKQLSPSALCCCMRSTKAILSTEVTGSTLDKPKHYLCKMEPLSRSNADSTTLILTHLTSVVTPTSCQFTPP